MYNINVILLFLYKNHADTYNFTSDLQGVTMTEINNIYNLAGQIFDKLDAQDGKKDGTINKSIWNAMANEHGGKEIKNSIKKENAVKSIVTYLKRLAQNENLPIQMLAQRWLNNISGAVDSMAQPPVKDTNPPTKDDNPPTTDSNHPTADSNPPTTDTRIPQEMCKEELEKYNTPNEAMKNEFKTSIMEGDTITKENPDGTKTEYDKNGYVVAEYDVNGNQTREITRNADGSVSSYIDYEYDANGNKTRTIARSDDGSVSSYTDSEYDANGNQTRYIDRNADGSVDYYNDYEYDENGNKTREIARNADGSVDYYWDYEYDANGNQTRAIRRNANGSVKGYMDYEYDAKGNEARIISRNADGKATGVPISSNDYFFERNHPQDRHQSIE